MRVLIAEDDAALASFVRKGLEAEHYAVDVTADGEQARVMAGELDYDLLMLDLNLPRVDGVTILRHLRTRKPSMPILVLTSRNRVEDRVQCLDLGADDYMGKPFSFAELSARIRALLRRSHLPAASVLTVADLKLDRVERRVERAGKRIELTSKEFTLLEYLMLNAGQKHLELSETSQNFGKRCVFRRSCCPRAKLYKLVRANLFVKRSGVFGGRHTEFFFQSSNAALELA